MTQEVLAGSQRELEAQFDKIFDSTFDGKDFQSDAEKSKFVIKCLFDLSDSKKLQESVRFKEYVKLHFGELKQIIEDGIADEKNDDGNRVGLRVDANMLAKAAKAIGFLALVLAEQEGEKWQLAQLLVLFNKSGNDPEIQSERLRLATKYLLDFCFEMPNTQLLKGSEVFNAYVRAHKEELKSAINATRVGMDMAQSTQPTKIAVAVAYIDSLK